MNKNEKDAMEETQLERSMSNDWAVEQDRAECLKEYVTLTKFKKDGRSYARVFFLNFSEDAIDYLGSRRSAKRRIYKIKEIDEVRRGFTTAVWKSCLQKRRVSAKQEPLAFSILYDNNRNSLDLLAESEEMCHRWIDGLEFLLARYRAFLRTHHPITDRWIWKIFANADRDHSGFLSRRECRTLLQLLNFNLDQRQFDEYFREADIRRDSSEQMNNLDPEEFLTFYKYISYRPELAEILGRFDENCGSAQPVESVHQIALSNPLGDEERRDSTGKFAGTIKRPFPRRMKRLRQKRWPTVEMINEENSLTVEQFKEFLHQEQQMRTFSINDCARLIERFEPSDEGREHKQISADGLRRFLLHDDFCLLKPSKAQKIYQDMTRPLSEYFIATSHNTYIRDTQVYGDCTPEMYSHVLRMGCRAVELDCYDGDDGHPIVHHGKTFMVAVHFRDIICAIARQAFTVSPYPLFLNIENHCSYDQQGVMSQILRSVFEDRLVTKPLTNDFETLPSPEDLKFRVLVRSRRFPKGKVVADPKSDRSSDENEPNPKDFNPEFAELIVYSQTVSFVSLQHTLSTQKCFHSISFSENKAGDLIRNGKIELSRLAQRQIVRVYPGFARQDSSNANPMKYWLFGVQMAALNYQSNDQAMLLQSGLFSDNGGCGYVLKPAFLRHREKVFNPAKPLVTRRKQLTLKIISAQHLPRSDTWSIADPYVKISTHGVPADCSERRTPAVHNNGLNPIWNFPIRMKINCPEFCLLAFRVRDEDRYSRSEFLGQTCVPLNAIQPGFRHVKLRGRNGDFIRGTLFIHIKLEDY